MFKKTSKVVKWNIKHKFVVIIFLFFFFNNSFKPTEYALYKHNCQHDFLMNFYVNK